MATRGQAALAQGTASPPALRGPAAKSPPLQRRGPGSPRRLRGSREAAQRRCRNGPAHAAPPTSPLGPARRGVPCCPPSSAAARPAQPPPLPGALLLRGGEGPWRTGPAAQLPRPGGNPQPRPARRRPGRKKGATGGGRARTVPAVSLTGWRDGRAPAVPAPGAERGSRRRFPPVWRLLLRQGCSERGRRRSVSAGRRWVGQCRSSGVRLPGRHRLHSPFLHLLFFFFSVPLLLGLRLP